MSNKNRADHRTSVGNTQVTFTILRNDFELYTIQDAKYAYYYDWLIKSKQKIGNETPLAN